MSSPRKSLAGRAASWSAVHRKKAIFGWLAFVIVAFMFGNNVVGTTTISTVDGFNGESHDAEQAADDAGLRPNGEVVLIQSAELTIEDAGVHDGDRGRHGSPGGGQVRREHRVASRRRGLDFRGRSIGPGGL